MRKSFTVVGILLLALVSPLSVAQAHQVEIDIDTARQTLSAVQKIGLTEQEARALARLPGNRALISKQKELGDGGTEERFVEELLAAANDKAVAGESAYNFTGVRKRAIGIGNVLGAIERDKRAFIEILIARIAPFSPRGSNYRLSGAVVVGGGSSGFALDDGAFYLNADHYADDLETAQLIMAHELYHAVQTAAVTEAGLRGKRGFNKSTYIGLEGDAQRRYAVEGFLYELLTEGTAMYIGDPALMKSDSWIARFERERLELESGRMDRLATHLDASLLALTHEQPIGWEPIYALGFYGPDQPLYYLGYAMAKAIAQKQGPGRLGELATGTGCDFLRDYSEVRSTDPTLPEIGPSTLKLADQYCV